MEIPSNGPTLVAVCQMNSTNDVDRNLGICEDLVRKAKSRGAKVRFLCSHMIEEGHFVFNSWTRSSAFA